MEYLKQHIDTIFYHQDVDKLMSFDAVTSQESLQLKTNFPEQLVNKMSAAPILDYLNVI